MNEQTHKLTANTKEQTELEFDLQMSGVDANQISCILFVDHPDDYSLGFKCQHVDEQTWSVEIPPLENIISAGTHSFQICVFVDNYYFKPVEGSIFVVAETPEVKIKNTEPQVTFKQSSAQSDDNNQVQSKQDPEHEEANNEKKQVDATPTKRREQQPTKRSADIRESKQPKNYKQDAETEQQTKQHRHGFFPGGSPRQIAERIRGMPAKREMSQDETVKKILSEYSEQNNKRHKKT